MEEMEILEVGMVTKEIIDPSYLFIIPSLWILQKLAYNNKIDCK